MKTLISLAFFSFFLFTNCEQTSSYKKTTKENYVANKSFHWLFILMTIKLQNKK